MRQAADFSPPFPRFPIREKERREAKLCRQRNLSTKIIKNNKNKS